MKKLTLLFIAVASLAVISSCKKSSSTVVSTPTNNMSALVNGVPWGTTAGVGTNASGPLTLTGTASDGETITLKIAPMKTGKYVLNSTSASSAIYSPTATSLSFFATGADSTATGTINLTSLDTSNLLASGTFSFTGVNIQNNTKKNITGGSFTNLPYRDVHYINSFSATINGTLWSTQNVLGDTMGGAFSITAYRNSDNSYFSLFLPANVKTGSYALASAWPSNWGAYSPPSTEYISQNGTVNVTTKTATLIKGTFQLNATNKANASDKVSVTAGSFSIQTN
jgi:uncharacterized protein DUF6252